MMPEAAPDRRRADRRRDRARAPAPSLWHNGPLPQALGRPDGLGVRRPDHRARAATDRHPHPRRERGRGRPPHRDGLAAQPRIAVHRQLGRAPPAQAQRHDRRRPRPRRRRAHDPDRLVRSTRSHLWQLYAVALLAGLAHVCFITAYPAVLRLPGAEGATTSRRTASSAPPARSSFVAGPAVGGWSGPAADRAVRDGRRRDRPSSGRRCSCAGSSRRADHRDRRRSTSIVARRAVRGHALRAAAPVRRGRACSRRPRSTSSPSSRRRSIVLFASRTLGLSPGADRSRVRHRRARRRCSARVLAPRISRRIGLGPSAMVGVVAVPAADRRHRPSPTGRSGRRSRCSPAPSSLSAFGVMLYDINLNVDPGAASSPTRSAAGWSAPSLTVNYGIRPLGAVVGGVLGSDDRAAAEPC